MHVLARLYRQGGHANGCAVLGDRLGFGDGPSGQLVARLNIGGKWLWRRHRSGPSRLSRQAGTPPTHCLGAKAAAISGRAPDLASLSPRTFRISGRLPAGRRLPGSPCGLCFRSLSPVATSWRRPRRSPSGRTPCRRGRPTDSRRGGSTPRQ